MSSGCGEMASDIITGSERISEPYQIKPRLSECYNPLRPELSLQHASQQSLRSTASGNMRKVSTSFGVKREFHSDAVCVCVRVYHTMSRTFCETADSNVVRDVRYRKGESVSRIHTSCSEDNFLSPL